MYSVHRDAHVEATLQDIVSKQAALGPKDVFEVLLPTGSAEFQHHQKLFMDEMKESKQAPKTKFRIGQLSTTIPDFKRALTTLHAWNV